MNLWIVGEKLSYDDDNESWHFVGVFSSRELARDACITPKHFIGPASLDVEINEPRADWDGAFYPLLTQEIIDQNAGH